VKLIRIDKKRKFLISKLHSVHTDKGTFPEEEISQNYGQTIQSNKGIKAHILYPTLEDIIKKLDRKTQILFPKELAMLPFLMDLRIGSTVVECGTGSGSASIFFSNMIGPTGKLLSFERRFSFINIAKQNLKKFSQFNNYHLINADIKEKFPIQDEIADAVFIDVPEPFAMVEAVYKVLKPGKSVVFLVPTTTQIIELLETLKTKKFVATRILEILHREWNPNPKALRPTDRMIAHTAFLVQTFKII